MDYAELIRIGSQNNYSDARDLIEEMPRLVELAQGHVVDRIDHDAFETELPAVTLGVTGQIDKATEFAGTDILELRGVHVDPGRGFIPIIPRDYDMLVALYSDGRTGTPRHYADRNATIDVYPRPFREMSLKVTANVKPAVLSEGAPTNVLTDEFPIVMEMAVNRQVAIFMMDPANKEMFEGQLADQLMAANTRIGRAKRNETAQRPVDTSNVTGA